MKRVDKKVSTVFGTFVSLNSYDCAGSSRRRQVATQQGESKVKAIYEMLLYASFHENCISPQYGRAGPHTFLQHFAGAVILSDYLFACAQGRRRAYPTPLYYTIPWTNRGQACFKAYDLVSGDGSCGWGLITSDC